MSLNFRSLIRPAPRRAVFAMEDWYVWCGSLARTDDGIYHLLFSRWPRALGHSAWVTHSEIAHATASDPLGPYTFQGVVLPGSGGDRWDADVTHNPTIIRVGKKYYLYYMGNRGNGEFWNHRNNQRIGVAVADHPAGPWQRFDRPLIDVTPGAWDCLMTSNPSCVQGPDGRFVLLYKGVGAGPLPKGGAVLCGVAFADNPLGPFLKHPEPIIVNPENDWAVEDAFAWYQDDRFYCLIKDFQGYFNHSEKGCLALFESPDGVAWQPAPEPLAARREIAWEDGTLQPVAYLERPQLWLENGKPAVLLCACDPNLDESRQSSFNVQLPLAGYERLSHA